MRKNRLCQRAETEADDKQHSRRMRRDQPKTAHEKKDASLQNNPPPGSLRARAYCDESAHYHCHSGAQDLPLAVRHCRSGLDGNCAVKTHTGHSDSQEQRQMSVIPKMEKDGLPSRSHVALGRTLGPVKVPPPDREPNSHARECG